MKLRTARSAAAVTAVTATTVQIALPLHLSLNLSEAFSPHKYPHSANGSGAPNHEFRRHYQSGVVTEDLRSTINAGGSAAGSAGSSCGSSELDGHSDVGVDVDVDEASRAARQFSGPNFEDLYGGGGGAGSGGFGRRKARRGRARARRAEDCAGNSENVVEERVHTRRAVHIPQPSGDNGDGFQNDMDGSDQEELEGEEEREYVAELIVDDYDLLQDEPISSSDPLGLDSDDPIGRRLRRSDRRSDRRRSRSSSLAARRNRRRKKAPRQHTTANTSSANPTSQTISSVKKLSSGPLKNDLELSEIADMIAQHMLTQPGSMDYDAFLEQQCQELGLVRWKSCGDVIEVREDGTCRATVDASSSSSTAASRDGRISDNKNGKRSESASGGSSNKATFQGEVETIVRDYDSLETLVALRHGDLLAQDQFTHYAIGFARSDDLDCPIDEDGNPLQDAASSDGSTSCSKCAYFFLAGSFQPDTRIQFTFQEQLQHGYDILNLVNQERSKYDLTPLTLDTEALFRAAEWHSHDMVTYGYPSQRNGGKPHLGTDGSTGQDRVEREGYDAVTVRENILSRYSLDAVGAFEQWMESDGHRRNILADDVTAMGLAVTCDATAGQYFYTQVLAAPFQKVEDPFDLVQPLLYQIHELRSVYGQELLTPHHLLSDYGTLLAAYVAKHGELPPNAWEKLGPHYPHTQITAVVAWTHDHDVEKIREHLFPSDRYSEELADPDYTEVGIGVYCDEEEKMYYNVVILAQPYRLPEENASSADGAEEVEEAYGANGSSHGYEHAYEHSYTHSYGGYDEYDHTEHQQQEAPRDNMEDAYLHGAVGQANGNVHAYANSAGERITPDRFVY